MLQDSPPDQTPAPAAAARLVAAAAAARAARIDRTGAFPAEDVAALHEAGLLAAPVPARLGGRGLGSDRLGSPELLEVLRQIGRGNLALGRLYEGHVNTWRLIARFAPPDRQRRLAADAAAGHLFAVWNTQGSDPVRLEPAGSGFVLRGAKIFASGAGEVTRPLVTARMPDGGVRMLVVPVADPGPRADQSLWQVSGMRASCSGAFSLDGIEVAAGELLGGDGAYEQEPDFSAGIWRVAAVHLGGIEALAEAAREHLRRTGRGGDPYQAMRLGQIAMAAETARLWLARAVALMEAPDEAVAGDELVAYVHLARLATERAALDVLELAHRSVGMQAFLRPCPIERITRDLQLYLRQPAPDRALASAAAWVLEAGAPLGDLWMSR
ncbi:acyl-CoA dehydrogenase family protein [Marinimicrococcus flavescens]|uniref:Acyl-CoA dehydrogenase family protein n=1 Tax=Marinimicrococcus flavescens TaxID=3031815 RepID=A0AAP3XRW0_9PROT|nr:acyl-CoA dehydrogenase family protein [Marinimicrococcus flavescens]